MCIGDRYRIGGALFEVTQPRVTCYRLGIRMNEPEMAALVVKHGRPGFYFRVLEEGEVEAGNEITQVASGPERMSVFDLTESSLGTIEYAEPAYINCNEAPVIRDWLER